MRSLGQFSMIFNGSYVFFPFLINFLCYSVGISHFFQLLVNFPCYPIGISHLLLFFQFPMLFNRIFAFYFIFKFSMLFNGKLSFCQFSMAFSGNWRFENGGGGCTDRQTYIMVHPLGPLPKKCKRHIISV